MNVVCLKCGKQFQKKPNQVKRHPRHFCSSSCAASINNLGKQRNKPKLKKARKIPTTQEIKLMTISDYQSRLSVVGKHPSWVNSHIRAFNRSWNSQLRKLPCQVCGYHQHVELAHIKAIASFSASATLGDVNHPSNVLVFCPNHHWEFDSGILSLENIQERKVKS
mgnify:CR=1 FL=1